MSRHPWSRYITKLQDVFAAFAQVSLVDVHLWGRTGQGGGLKLVLIAALLVRGYLRNFL